MNASETSPALTHRGPVGRAINATRVRTALHLVTYADPARIDAPAPVCGRPKLCSPTGCRFPRYARDGRPDGLIATILIKLGYPMDLLKELDTEYELGEVLHPGVKITRSRNAALTRLDTPGVVLLGFLQERQHTGTWAQLFVQALSPKRGLKSFDRNRRPWLYETETP